MPIFRAITCDFHVIQKRESGKDGRFGAGEIPMFTRHVGSKPRIAAGFHFKARSRERLMCEKSTIRWSISVESHRSCPKVSSACTDISCGPQGEKTCLRLICCANEGTSHMKPKRKKPAGFSYSVRVVCLSLCFGCMWSRCCVVFCGGISGGGVSLCARCACKGIACGVCVCVSVYVCCVVVVSVSGMAVCTCVLWWCVGGGGGACVCLCKVCVQGNRVWRVACLSDCVCLCVCRWCENVFCVVVWRVLWCVKWRVWSGLLRGGCCVKWRVWRVHGVCTVCARCVSCVHGVSAMCTVCVVVVCVVSGMGTVCVCVCGVCVFHGGLVMTRNFVWSDG